MINHNQKQTILVVDDIPENIDVLNSILQDDYQVKAALDGERALNIVNGDTPPDLILLDIMMPGMDGYQVCSRIKSSLSTRNIPIVFVTAKDDIENETRGLELGAVDYITKPVSPPIVKARIRTHLALYDQNRELESMVQQRTVELSETRLEIIRRLGRAAEFKDNETGLHIIRISYYARLIAQEMGLSEDHIDILFNASPMHDIGKIGIPDKILMKPGKLDPGEWEIMKQHTTIGADIIGDHGSELLQMARMISLTHHEKWNGSGYPEGLSGENIPIEGRIVAIADVFDALTNERPYKKAWTIEDACDLINKESGEHFDPSLVEVFSRIIPQIVEIHKLYVER